MIGEIVHIEIPGGADTTQTRAFWAALFGWQFKEVPGSRYGDGSLDAFPMEQAGSTRFDL